MVVAVLLAGCKERPKLAEQGDAAGDSHDRIAASQILIGWAGLRYIGPPPAPTRTQEDARALATRIADEARRAPDEFARLARLHSEGAGRDSGGLLPSWHAEPGDAVGDAIRALEIGEIAGPLTWDYGYLIVKREPVAPRTTLSARMLVVAWAGARRAPSSITRTRGEALARANELHAEAVAAPSRMEALVRASSDGWTRETGGALGTWESEQTPIPPDLERALLALELDAVSPPLETALGYVLLQRLAPSPRPQQLAAAHLLIAYRDAPRPRQGVTRSKDEARQLATELAARARAAPASFGALAQEHSDDGTAASGGELGAWVVGEKMPRAIDDAVRGVAIGAIAGPIETEFGFHVLVRRASPQDRADSYARGPLAEHDGEGAGEGGGGAHDHAHESTPAPTPATPATPREPLEAPAPRR